jgi:hypothetical protein
MLTRGTIAAVSVVAALTTGCGKTSFGGGGKQGHTDRTGADGKGEEPAQTSEGDENDGKPTGGNDDGPVILPADPNPEQEAIGHCLEAWGSNPFGQTAFTDYRVVKAAVNVLGSGPLVSDTQVTNEPRLIVVKAGVSVLGDSGYELLNPNGWYCLMVDVSVMAKVKVDLHCQAHLADNKVYVNVGSNGTGAASVGVAVLSDIKVNRVGTGKTGC